MISKANNKTYLKMKTNNYKNAYINVNTGRSVLWSTICMTVQSVRRNKTSYCANIKQISYN